MSPELFRLARDSAIEGCGGPPELNRSASALPTGHQGPSTTPSEAFDTRTALARPLSPGRVDLPRRRVAVALDGAAPTVPYSFLV